MIRNIKKYTKSPLIALLSIILPLGGWGGFVSCVDNDDLDNAQGTFYSATKRTAAEIIGDDAERCSMFQAILEKANYYSLLSVYGNYTVFVPTNDAIKEFMANNNYSSLDALLEDEPQSIEFIPVPQDKARKYMINGQIYIALPDGKVFDVRGLRVR